MLCKTPWVGAGRELYQGAAIENLVVVELTLLMFRSDGFFKGATFIRGRLTRPSVPSYGTPV